MRGSGGLDAEWYLKRYPDVAKAGLDPYHHYAKHGWREGRDPRPDFSTSGYLFRYHSASKPPLPRINISSLSHSEGCDI